MQTIRLKWLVTGAFISSVGNSFIWPLTSVYLHNNLHQSLTTVGIVLLMYSGSNIVGSYIAGRLYDRLNPFRLMIGGILLAILTTFLMIFWHGWPAYPIALIFVGFGTGWLITLTNSLGTTIKGRDGRFVFNMLYFGNNLGIVFGTSIVGFVYSHSIPLLFAIAASLYVVFLVVVLRYFRPAANVVQSRRERNEPVVRLPKANMTVIYVFFISLAIIWVMYQQWVSNLSVYMTGMGIPMEKYSFLWTLNAGLIVIFQVFINWMAHWVKNPYWQIYVGLVFVTLSFVVLIWAHEYRDFVIAMTILTVGEATAFPAIPALVNDLTPLASKGKYQGLSNSWASAGKALGPLFGGLVIEAVSYTRLFEIAAVANVVVLVGIVVVVQLVGRKATVFK